MNVTLLLCTFDGTLSMVLKDSGYPWAFPYLSLIMSAYSPRSFPAGSARIPSQIWGYHRNVNINITRNRKFLPIPMI